MTTTLEFRWSVSRGRDTYGYNICTLYLNGRKVARCNGGGYDMKGTCYGSFIASHYANRLLGLKKSDMPKQSHWNSNHRQICRGQCHEEYMTALIDDKKPAELPTYERWVNETCPVCGGELGTTDMGERIDEGRYFYGLTYHDPNYDPADAVIGIDASDRTIGGEAKGMTVGEAEAAGKSLGLERYQAIYSASSKHPTKRHTVPSIDGGCGMRCVEDIAKTIGITLEYVPTRKKHDSIYILHDSTAAE
jgi:hypothetical protein